MVIVVMLEERSVVVAIVLRGMCIRRQASQARTILMVTLVDIVGGMVHGIVDQLIGILLRYQARWKHKRLKQQDNRYKIKACLRALLGLSTRMTEKPEMTSGS
jgi:hypothetical protein